MTDLRTAAQQALEALLTPSGAQACSTCQNGPENEYCCRMEMWSAVDALRAVLAQQEEPQTLDESMQQPRATAQAYDNGYKAGVAHEREACAQVCEARFVGDLTREDMEARRCAAAIRARGNT